MLRKYYTTKINEFLRTCNVLPFSCTHIQLCGETSSKYYKMRLICVIFGIDFDLRFQIDLDTIDVTNLNRQFLFQKCHVGMSKSKVARESCLTFVPDAKVEAIHDSIMIPEYGVTFFKKFQMVSRLKIFFIHEQLHFICD